ncbi:MAG: peptidoglycan DD-metalloendopeptidase family protein [Microcoleaceae cyanobacterium]
MSIAHGTLLILLGMGLSLGLPTLANEALLKDAQDVCPQPALSRLQRHRVTEGETLETIARQYNLIPATLLGMNSDLRTGRLLIGQELLIPPYNGIQVEVPAGSTWQEIAKRYNAQADVLFEVNGCQLQPRMVFIPGVNWTPAEQVTPALTVLSGYPLPNLALVQLSYGWQLHPVKNVVVFHSGIDFDATVGTSVLSVGEGVVAFAGERQEYGNLVVVNHPAGKQTRYAHLKNMTVKTGQTVRPGETIGTVGITGQPDSNQPHLHFEIRYNSDFGWIAEDPSPYFTQFSRPTPVPSSRGVQ